jgi:hypothetical protein
LDGGWVGVRRAGVSAKEVVYELVSSVEGASFGSVGVHFEVGGNVGHVSAVSDSKFWFIIREVGEDGESICSMFVEGRAV